ncbi:hypothetical protein B0H19DRAFT_1268252 [Mycena capillaripes]|nr:hypothetical protein B0H19DRAFT_1268252 [Mycena capillaripes]
MDSFTTIDFLPTQPLAAASDVPISAAVHSHPDEESIRELVDEDTKVGFGATPTLCPFAFAQSMPPYRYPAPVDLVASRYPPPRRPVRSATVRLRPDRPTTAVHYLRLTLPHYLLRLVTYIDAFIAYILLCLSIPIPTTTVRFYLYYLIMQPLSASFNVPTVQSVQAL